jgi:O-antigen/teichoic acid export membrane protein
VEPGGASDSISSAEVRRRAAGGVGLLVARGVLIQGFGVVANIVLARLLLPRDFGLVALGTAFLLVGAVVSEGGLGGALIRREQSPTRQELAAVNGLQVGITTLIAVAVAAAAIPLGRDGLVVAAMTASLPITILRAPSVIMLERRLSFRPVAAGDVSEALSYYVWAIATVALGMGVWGMATAVVVRAVVGTGVTVALGPVGFVRPRWSWRLIRPLLGFGAKFQAAIALTLVRDQGLNTGVAAIAGVTTLGIWNLAYRVIQVPYMLVGNVTRIWYPAMSRLLAAREDPRDLMTRAAAAFAVVLGAVLVAVVGFAPALPALVGERWHDVPLTLAFACLGLMIGAPAAVTASGYLYAAGDAGAVLRAVAAQTAAWFTVAFATLPALGAPAVGIGWTAAACANRALLVREVRLRTGARFARKTLVPTGVALVAGLSGWAIASAGEANMLRGALGAAAAELVLAAGLATLSRPLLRATVALVASTARGSRGPRSADAAPVEYAPAEPV